MTDKDTMRRFGHVAKWDVIYVPGLRVMPSTNLPPLALALPQATHIAAIAAAACQSCSSCA